MALQIYLTKRFVKSYERGTAIQFLVDGAVQDFTNRYYADASQVARNYQRIAGSKDPRLMEFEISGGCRMIGHWQSPRLTLLDVGDHELVPRFSLTDVPRLLAGSVPAPSGMFSRNGAFFLPDRAGTTGSYANEIAPEWLYFLDEEQDALAVSIVDSIENRVLGGDAPGIHLVLGGPGTGKTCVLLNLLLRLWHHDKLETRLVMPKRIKDYVEASLGITLSETWLSLDGFQYAARARARPLDVLLLDDPHGLQDLKLASTLVQDGAARVVVAAFDPLQFDEAVTDADFDHFANTNRAAIHHLTMCYRQKENVGAQTKNATTVLAASTPFLDKTKKKDFLETHSRLTELANTLRFSNPAGYLRSCMPADSKAFVGEVRRISETPALLWKHAPSLLIAMCDPGLEALPSDCLQALDRFPAKYDIIKSVSLASVKGLEYQHVFIVLDQRTFNAMESGFDGSGKRVYEQRRLLRIPFSRAKDSLVIFAWGEPGSSPAA